MKNFVTISLKNILLLAVWLLGVDLVTAQEQQLPVSEPISSGCLPQTRSTDSQAWPTIVLKKESNILSVELLNYSSNCGTTDFKVNTNMSESSNDATCTVTAYVTPVVPASMDCYCPFNVSFTVRGLESNRFYLNCWWYQGLVELTEGEALVLEDSKKDVTINGLTYTLRPYLHAAMLAKNKFEGELRIPSEVNYEGQTYPVTCVEGGAFSHNKAMTKVIVPRTLLGMNWKTEGLDALFTACTALESIEVEEGNPVMFSIDGVLFNKQKSMLLNYPAGSPRTSYTIPEGITSVGGQAFSYSQNLETIMVPDEVESLGAFAFSYSQKLKEIKLPSNLQKLEQSLFEECKLLQSVTIPQSVTTFSHDVFARCSSLVSFTMPESVDSVGPFLFERCTSLKSVKLSPKLKTLSFALFSRCSSLTDIEIPEGITSIESSFSNCTSLKTLDIPASVTHITMNTFYNCNLNNLYIRGIIAPSDINEGLFNGMDTQANVYVQPSEVEKFKAIYKGPVYPLSSEDQTMTGISENVFSSAASSTLHDLQGRRVTSQPRPGVYIREGKVVVVKYRPQ